MSDVKIYKRGRVWWVDFSVDGKRFRQSTGLREQRPAFAKAGKLLEAEELRAAGIETHRGTTGITIPDLVTEYEGVLRARGRTEEHIRLTGRRIRTLTGRASSIGKLTPEFIRKALARVEAAPRTVAYYRSALFSFFRWLVREDRWDRNPVEAVEPPRVVGKTRERRALTSEQLGALLDASPEHRAAIYLLAATTGLRRSEVNALSWDEIDLDEATVNVRAASAKNRRADVLPLPPHTVEALRDLKAKGKLYRRGRSLRTEFPPVPTIETFREDLEAAGIPYQDEQGRFADVHSLRATVASRSTTRAASHWAGSEPAATGGRPATARSAAAVTSGASPGRPMSGLTGTGTSTYSTT